MRFLSLFVILTGCIDYSVSRRYITDSFVQPSRSAGVDILWVIDDSASMFEEQDQLSSHANSFIGYLSLTPVDFQLAATTTDVSVEAPGAFLGEILTPETPDLANAFAEQIYLDEGSREEKGFEAALAALDLDGVNGEILRSSADLELIFFSDEDDQSDYSVDEFVNGLLSARPVTNVVVNAIVGDPPEGCASIYGAADAGDKYRQAQSQTDGIRESICSLNYDEMLSRVALKVLGLDNTVSLTEAPDLDTMTVRVDDALIHRRDRHGWGYDAGSNSIVFDGYAVPPPGAEVVIKYAKWIGPKDGYKQQEEEVTE